MMLEVAELGVWNCGDLQAALSCVQVAEGRQNCLNLKPSVLFCALALSLRAVLVREAALASK